LAIIRNKQLPKYILKYINSPKECYIEIKMKKIFWQTIFVAREVLIGIVQAAIMIFAGILIAGFFIYKFQTPSAEELTKRKIPQTSIIYDRSGKQELYEIHGEENRKILTHEQIPEAMRAATLAAEDKNFYRHGGIDLVATARAIEIDIKNHDMRQGASTITQQLARNVFLGREKTIWRKFLEAIIAIKIEQSFTKEQILDNYLNQVPYGSNAYGVQSAAEIYFGKNASELSLAEAALLASLPKAPAHYSPYGMHQDELAARQKNVLSKMRYLGFISADEEKAAIAENILSKINSFREPIRAPHFVFFVIDQLEEQYGREYLETGGLKIITTLDWDMQKSAEQVLEEGAARNISRGVENGALVALEPKSGAILAMAGSKDYFATDIDGKVNVTTSPRQPGSSFKPIVYAAAFEKGFQPETRITDSLTNFGPDGSGRPYVPRNYDGRFHGTMPMRSALARSLNVPAVKTLSMVGLPAGKEMAARLGISTLSEKANYGLSFAIGAAEVWPLDMAGVFSVFANDGIKNTPYAMERVEKGDGKVDQHVKNPVRVLDPQVARKIDSILSDNKARTPTFGAKSPLAFPDGVQVAAKTGTSQDFKDAWTIGFTPSLAVAVWVGNNDGRLMNKGSDGVFVAAPIWRAFMDQNLPRFAQQAFVPYEVDEKIKRTQLAADAQSRARDQMMEDMKNKIESHKSRHH
jgi:1A family penicillin-binding protein